jgi:hypothetical protein
LFEHLQTPITIDRERWSLTVNKKFFFFVKREVRFRWERLIKGYCYSDTWNLETHLAEHLCGSIKEFKAAKNGHPSNLTWEEWNDILDKMAFGFCNYVEQVNYMPPIEEWRKHYHETNVHLDRSFKLLRKYFRDLWW